MSSTSSIALAAALLILLAACGTATPAAAPSAPPTDPELTAEVTTAFVTYRQAVAQGDAEAAVENLSQASRTQMADLAEQALSLTADETRALPAADQLIVLTYRLFPDIMTAEDPYRALVDRGLAGQDRSLGGLGPVNQVDDDLALGVVVDEQSQRTTPLRWRFVREDGAWRFDLVDAHRLLSQAIANTARLQGVEVSALVVQTILDVSTFDVDEVAAAYEPPEQ